MNQNKLLNSNSRPKHRHETSMDNFIKNIKKHNQRSERYMSPPLLYMYSRNHTTNTIDKSRSRTLSNRKSSIAATPKIIKKINSILKEEDEKSHGNPAEVLESCGSKLKRLEKYLSKKNQIGHHLCQNFLKMLNSIVEKMVHNLATQLREIEAKAQRKVKKQYNKSMKKMTSINQKLEHKLKESLQKLDNNSQLIYHIRMLSQIDVDYIYGKCIMKTDQCGGIGYGNRGDSQSQITGEHSRLQHHQESMSDEAFAYRKELFHFEEASGKKKKKQTAPERDEGQAAKQSGRIRQVPSKKFPPRRPPPQQQLQEEESIGYRPEGRRFT